MLLVDALKEVYKALGGSADDVANMSQNADVIAAIATKAGSGLPAVSATDNGDVLTVVEGAWAKAEPSGGGAVVIEGTVSAEVTGFSFTMIGKTIGDLSALISAGKDIILKDDAGILYRLYRFNTGAKAYFLSAYVSNISTRALAYSGLIAILTQTSSKKLDGISGVYTPSTQ